MSAPAGNTNATKWTRSATISMLHKIEELALDESIFTLSQALLRLRCYKQLWTYWKNMWALDADIMDHIYFIEQLFMNKLEEAALFKRLNPSACYFILRQNYGYDARGKDELPSHLVADLEPPQTDTPDATIQKKDDKKPPVTTAMRGVLQDHMPETTAMHSEADSSQRQAGHSLRR
ncbi:MAG: hypothetical protein JSS76_12865 [Bacteroidetes bacterium]|nr:hypothetical protein [Bacteroidota bacterium]